MSVKCIVFLYSREHQISSSPEGFGRNSCRSGRQTQGTGASAMRIARVQSRAFNTLTAMCREPSYIPSTGFFGVWSELFQSQYPWTGIGHPSSSFPPLITSFSRTWNLDLKVGSQCVFGVWSDLYFLFCFQSQYPWLLVLAIPSRLLQHWAHHLAEPETWIWRLGVRTWTYN